MTIEALDVLITIAVGLAINFASTLLFRQVPEAARHLAGQWLVRTIVIGVMVIGSSLAVITSWAWCAPLVAVLCFWGSSLRHRRQMARRHLDPLPVWAERSRRRHQGFAAEFALVGLFAAGLSALIYLNVDRHIPTALQTGDTIGVWVWAIMLVPFSVLFGQIAVFLAWHIRCSIELRLRFLH